MRDTRQEDKVSVVNNILQEYFSVMVDEGIISNDVFNETSFNYLTSKLLQAIEQVETDYHNKWEEMKCEEQYQERSDANNA